MNEFTATSSLPGVLNESQLQLRELLEDTLHAFNLNGPFLSDREKALVLADLHVRYNLKAWSNQKEASTPTPPMHR